MLLCMAGTTYGMKTGRSQKGRPRTLGNSQRCVSTHWGIWLRRLCIANRRGPCSETDWKYESAAIALGNLVRLYRCSIHLLADDTIAIKQDGRDGSDRHRADGGTGSRAAD